MLTVTTTYSRMMSLKRTTEDAKGRASYWFTTEDLIAYPADAFGAIWKVAGIDEDCSLLDHFNQVYSS